MRVAEQIGKLIDLCYVRPWSALLSRTMFRYAVCGGANMVLDVVWYFVIYHYIVAERFIDLGFVVMSPHVASLVVVFPITFFTGFGSIAMSPFVLRRWARVCSSCDMPSLWWALFC